MPIPTLPLHSRCRRRAMTRAAFRQPLWQLAKAEACKCMCGSLTASACFFGAHPVLLLLLLLKKCASSLVSTPGASVAFKGHMTCGALHGLWRLCSPHPLFSVF